MKELWEQQERGGPLLGGPLAHAARATVSSAREGRYCTKPSLAPPPPPAARSGATTCRESSALHHTVRSTPGRRGLQPRWDLRWSPKSYRVWDRGGQGQRKANCSLCSGQRDRTAGGDESDSCPHACAPGRGRSGPALRLGDSGTCDSACRGKQSWMEVTQHLHLFGAQCF